VLMYIIVTFFSVHLLHESTWSLLLNFQPSVNTINQQVQLTG